MRKSSIFQNPLSLLISTGYLKGLCLKKNFITQQGLLGRFLLDEEMKQNMLWLMDKSFQVATTIQKPGKPEKTTTVKVAWNEGDDQ